MELIEYKWLDVETATERESNEDRYDECRVQVGDYGCLVVVSGRKSIVYNASEWKRAVGRMAEH